MPDYYDRRLAFFPRPLNGPRRRILHFYLLGRTEAAVRAHSHIVGGPDSLPKTIYGRSGPRDGPMRVRRAEAHKILFLRQIPSLQQMAGNTRGEIKRIHRFEAWPRCDHLSQYA